MYFTKDHQLDQTKRSILPYFGKSTDTFSRNFWDHYFWSIYFCESLESTFLGYFWKKKLRISICLYQNISEFHHFILEFPIWNMKSFVPDPSFFTLPVYFGEKNLAKNFSFSQNVPPIKLFIYITTLQSTLL